MTAPDQHNPPSAIPHPPSGPAGARYWRSLEEYAGSAELQQWVSQEFPTYDPEQIRSMSRRGFLKLAGASMALAGLTMTGCRRWPAEKIAPFAHRPENRVPGESEFYASIFEHGGNAVGILVETFDGRPIKVEGNPLHPYSLGATDAYAQASVLTMYDPDRSRIVLTRKPGATTDEPASFTRGTWDDFAAAMSSEQRGRTAVLAESSSSPTLRRLRTALGGVQWFEYDAVQRAGEVAGARQAFGGGRTIRPVFELRDATIIASFDGDLLSTHPAALKYARDWAAGRKTADAAERSMNRLYVAESAFSCTGSVADERLPIKSSLIPTLLAAVAKGLGMSGPTVELTPKAQAWVQKLVADLQANRGKSVVSVGPLQPAEAHTLAWQINAHLGNIGTTVVPHEEPAAANEAGTIQQLVEAINGGQIDTLVLLGGNPVYDAPADLGFAAALKKVKTTARLGLYVDETSLACTWHLPQAFYLEAWGDGLAWDGTYGIQQPLILPLFEGRSAIEVVSMLGGEPKSGYDLVRETFAANYGGGQLDETKWRNALHDGLVEGTAFPALEGAQPQAQAAAEAIATPADDKTVFEVTFNADASVYDGRWANNGWLIELPGPLTKLTWGNAAWVNIHDAQQLGLAQGDHVRVTVGDRSIDIPAYLMPGQARGSVALHLGYGRTAPLSVANGVGVNVAPIRLAATPAIVTGVKLAKAEGWTDLLLTQNHHLIDAVGASGLKERVGGKNASGLIVRDTTLDNYIKNPQFVHANEHGDFSLQLYQPPAAGVVKRGEGEDVDVFRSPHAWAMTIDMSACTGCSACVVACQAENNIPVVGPEMVKMGREMHWLRIDRYFKTEEPAAAEGSESLGDPYAEDPQVVWQPMLCVHCENAPCEEVCPVAATVHDTEGLNTMVYNRCIGTRYCSNNCPYKVRRFNYYDYHSKANGELFRKFVMPWPGMPDSQQKERVDPIRQLGFNPDVTVRMRGVMEKCTYCTQRISAARIAAKRSWQRGERAEPLIADGEVVTACQQACPTDAIVFGNLNDPNSRVSQLTVGDRVFAVLGDLNTRPRTRHLAKIRNPAAAVASARPAAVEAHG